MTKAKRYESEHPEASHVLQDCLWTAMAALATGLLCLPLFLVHVKPLNHICESETEKPSSARFVCIPQPIPNTPERLAFQNIRAWLQLQRPELFWNPSVTTRDSQGKETELGFQAIIPARPALSLHSLPEITLKMEPWKPRSLIGVPPSFSDQPLRRELLAHWPPYFEVELPAVPERPLRRGVFWCNISGHLMKDPPTVEAKAVQEALSKPPSVPNPTRITRLQLLPGPPVPRIIVRQSSGWPELDQLAASALRQRLPASFSQGEATLDVFWR